MFHIYNTSVRKPAQRKEKWFQTEKWPDHFDFDEILPAKTKLVKYLRGKCKSEYYQQLPFKYLSKSFSIPKLLSTVSWIQTTFLDKLLLSIKGLSLPASVPTIAASTIRAMAFQAIVVAFDLSFL